MNRIEGLEEKMASLTIAYDNMEEKTNGLAISNAKLEAELADLSMEAETSRLISRDIRLRHLNNFLKSNPEITETVGIRISHTSILSRNIAAHYGDAVVRTLLSSAPNVPKTKCMLQADARIVQTDSERLLFHTCYGLPVREVLEQKDNVRLLVLINARCTHWHRLPPQFRKAYVKLCNIILEGHDISKQVEKIWSLKFEFSPAFRRKSISWKQALKEHDNRLKAAKASKNL